MADQTNRIILLGVDNTGPATNSAKQNLVSLGNTAEMSAKQAAAAMRMVPAQMTDIVVSLASGQKPLTVLLQQGGQLKDMFGGIAPAAKALGAYLTSLINPVTLVAGALGAVVVAYVQGAKESEELNRVLILTGNYAGQTASSLNEMAKAMASTGKVTRGEAADALVEVISTGKIASSQLQGVAEAALNWSKVTGESVKTVVGHFVDLGEAPASASAKLNEQYHFLTLSVYEQIRALEEQGAKEQAAAVAEKALADAGNTRAKQLTENLGYLETAWNAVGKAAKGAWQAMKDALDRAKDIGRPETATEQLTAKQQELAIRLQRGAMRPDDPASITAFERGNQALRNEIALLERRVKVETDTAKQAGENQRAQDEAIGASDRVRHLEDQAKGIAAVDRELKKYHDDLERIRKVDPNSELLKPATVKATEADIRKRFAGSAPEQGIDARLKQLQGALQSEERATKMSLDRIQTDYVLGLTTTKEYLDQEYEAHQSSLERQIAIARQQEQLARGKQNIAAVEQYKNEAKKLQDEIEANFVKHNGDLEVLTAKRQRAVLEYTRSLDAELRVRQGSIDDILAGAGLSARQRDDQQRLLDVRRDFDRRKEALDRDRARPEAEGGISQEQYDKQLAAAQAFYDQRIIQEQDYNAKSQALREDWRIGAKQAFQEYADSARDAAGQSAKFFGDVLQGMEDALVEFATTGKLNFRSLANSIIADMARVEAKKLISGVFGAGGPGGGLLESLGSWLFGAGRGAKSAIDAGTPAFDFSVAAKGNVYQARGLSAYSNGIVRQPTIFAFARGAGLMAEAGPEAVMPLRRGADGRLGVDAATAGVNVTITNLGPAVDVTETRRNGNDIEVVIDRAAQRARSLVAQDLGNHNSKIAQGLTSNYTVQKRRS